MHANNKTKDILILSKRQRKGLENTSPTAEAEYSINFPRSERKFSLSLHYIGSNNFLLINTTKIHLFKAKDFETKNIFFVFRKHLKIRFHR